MELELVPLPLTLSLKALEKALFTIATEQYSLNEWKKTQGSETSPLHMAFFNWWLIRVCLPRADFLEYEWDGYSRPEYESS